ncbi:AbiV family abortive infection protein [Sulfurovum sp. XGS-02]|uniref:AbiV family abortive infection protein n=1 Tax=Sulfurovum sp. XGS-02 TaxID=2925411 RepID=UPI00205595BC|nr:AbiV family abortive infection protein [Sulfurovum sp. XGS-02]UPT77493.1 AbiV family abortive infection protein [Sulfurovum sp. XGS-02]
MEVFELISSMVRTDENLIQSVDDFNKAVDHIVQLIQDACTLYMNGSYPTSAFLSISACEEIAKAHIGSFTDGKHPEKNGRNIFRDHRTKHQMAALPTVTVAQRLNEALGSPELQRIMNLAHNSGFVQTRESALYFQRENGSLTIPAEKVDKKLARSLVLFAIEAFDDALVGVTNHTYEMDDITDALFEQIKNT